MHRVGIIGATGMVGQRFALLLQNHPWFQVTCVAASPKQRGETVPRSRQARWAFQTLRFPENVADLIVLDASDIAGDRQAGGFRFLRRRYAKTGNPRAGGSLRQGRECP